MKKFLTLLSATAVMAASASAAFIDVTANITTDTRWTRDNVYILRQVIYVLPPAQLTIEAGTIIRGVKEGSGFDTAIANSPGCLIISRGAQIFARGTADDPIVFTSIDDPNVIGGTATVPTTVNGNPVVPQNYTTNGATGANAFAYDGQWGGLVICGDAPIGYDGDGDALDLVFTPNANPALDAFSADDIRYPSSGSSGTSNWPTGADIKGGDGVGVAVIEGTELGVAFAAVYTEPFPGAPNAPAANTVFGGVYGGLDRNDDSGTLSFVESRYGGFLLGAGNEVNGITFGATGTSCDFTWLSSYNNADDGFEFFGGYTHFRYLFSLYAGDDGLDGDTGFNGTLQFAFAVTDNETDVRAGGFGSTITGRPAANEGDNAAEWDGSEGSPQGGITPNTNPYFYNFTLIAGPAAGKDAARLRRGVLGQWRNGLFQSVPDDAFRIDAASGAANEDTQASNVLRDYNAFADVADNATQSGTNVYSNDDSTALLAEIVNLPRTAAPWSGFVPNSLDPRLRSGAASANVANWLKPANRTDSYPYSGWVPAPIGGAMRDNNMLAGWTVAEYLDLLPTTNITRPVVSIGKSGSNPTVSFPAATGAGGRAVLYSVEVSVNGSPFTSLAVVSDNQGAGTVDKVGTTFATTDTNAAANAITITDTTNTLTAGVELTYRVNAL